MDIEITGNRSKLLQEKGWNDLLDLLIYKIDIRLRSTKTKRIEVMMRLMRISILNNKILVLWHSTSLQYRASEEMFDWIESAGFFDEVIGFRNYMPDLFQFAFAALGSFSRFGRAKRYSEFWGTLMDADSGFTREWFKAAYHESEKGWKAPSGFALKFVRNVETDFKNFVDWLDKGGEPRLP